MDLSRLSPRTDIRTARITLLWQQLASSFGRQQASRIATLDRIGDALSHLNPEAILARGFAVVRDANGDVVSDARLLTTGDSIYLRLAKGEIDATVLATRTS
jgi:exodeoxyribonuclease VII large subunit